MSQRTGPDCRVVLVGRTGLDAALRMDPRVELVRVRSTLEAVGEVAAPADPAGRTVVVIAPDAELGLCAEGEEIGPRVEAALGGLRRAEPRVVVMGMGPSLNGHAKLYDRVLLPGMPPDAIRAAVWGEAAPAHPATTGPAPITSTAVKSPAAPAEPVVRLQNAPEVGSEGDLPLVTIMLRGGDILGPALELIRARTGARDVAFVPGSGQDVADAQSPAGTPVTWDGAAMGVLTSALVTSAALSSHARWLAGWLRARDQQTQLRTAAFTDPLTGAWNRRYFERFLAAAIDQARAPRRMVTVLLFDIDNFKSYNDRYGHDAGDDILREAVRLLRSVIRPSDRVCRIGGDEFAVIFDEPQGPRQDGSKHPESVAFIAERFQKQIAAHRFPKLGDCAPGILGISGGLATFPWDGQTPEQLLAKADERAIHSKRQGKNAITFGRSELRDDVPPAPPGR